MAPCLRGLAVVFLMLKVVSASKIVFTTSPSEITPSLTPDLTLFCGLEDTPTAKKYIHGVEKVPYNVPHVLSIVVTRGDAEYVAMVTQISQAKAFVDKSSLTVQGNVEGTSGKSAFLELKWMKPEVNQSDTYKCEIHAMDHFGQPLELSKNVTVKLGKLRLKDVIQTLQKVQKKHRIIVKSLKAENDQCAAEVAELNANLTKLQRMTDFCPEGWTLFMDHCYKKLPNKLSYSEARSACQNEGSKIAMPKNSVEGAFIYYIMAGREITWIGLNDIKKEGNFVWEDGRSLLWTEKQWYRGQPNDPKYGENCVMIGWWQDPQWGDYICTTKYAAVCQTNARGVQ